MTVVDLPETLEEIDDEAFYGSSLTWITFPRDLRRIGKAAFAESRDLKWVVFRDGLQEIDDSAFKWCPLRKLLLKHGLRRIGAHAFEYCERIHYVKFSPSLNDIGKNAFLGCPMDETKLPPEIKRFAEKASMKEGSGNVIGNIIEMLNRWSIVHIIAGLLNRNNSASEGHYSIGIGKSNVSISIYDYDSQTYEHDDMYFNYQFSPEEFLQIMNELRNIQVHKHEEKATENTFIDSANRLYNELADYLHGLPKQDLQDTSSQ